MDPTLVDSAVGLGPKAFSATDGQGTHSLLLRHPRHPAMGDSRSAWIECRRCAVPQASPARPTVAAWVENGGISGLDMPLTDEPSLRALSRDSQQDGTSRWAALPPALRSRSTLHWGLLFLVVFLSIHWQEVTSPTYNVDDWTLLGKPINQAYESRPAWDVIYGLLFQNAFSPFFGWLMAAAVLFSMAACLPLFLPSLAPAWIFLAALLISLHAYLLDLFNFGFAVGLYLLPAALSLWGGVLIAYNPCPPLLGRRWLDAVAGVAMVAFAIGIYQPTAMLGIVLIAFDALGRSLGTIRPAPGGMRRLVAGFVLGLLIYGITARLAIIGQVPDYRTGLASFSFFLVKLKSIGAYREVYATQVALLWRPAQILLSSTFLLILLGLSMHLCRMTHEAEGRRHRLGLLWFSAGWCTVSPFFLYNVLQAGFPGRAFSLGNVGIVGFSVIGLAWLSGQAGPSPARRRLFTRTLVSLLIVGYVIPQAAYASRIWELAQLLERRDMAMAQAIAADVRSLSRTNPRLPAQTFRLYGTSERNQSFSHWSSVGESAFRASWSIEAIFHQLLGIEVEHLRSGSEGTPPSVDRSKLPACGAWPASDAVVPYEGRWLVCLESSPTASATAGSPPGSVAHTQ